MRGRSAPAADLLLEALTEKQWQQRVMETAAMAGWKRHHQLPGMFKDGRYLSAGGDTGFPDLVLAKRGRLVFAELKAQRGVVSPAQREWLSVLARTLPGVEVYVWRPADWREVQRVLLPGSTDPVRVVETSSSGGDLRLS